MSDTNLEALARGNACDCVDCGGESPTHSSDCAFMAGHFGEPPSCAAVTDHALVGDLGRKCADDVSSAVERNLSLLDQASDKFVVATFGASVAMAWASAALNEMLGEGADPGDVIDSLFDQLRPLVLSALKDAVLAARGQS